MNENMQKLDNMPVSKAVLTNVIPAMLGMVMALVYNMADLFFIGQTGDDLQVAAISMATPMFLMYMSLGNVFGVGGAAYLSRSLGAGKTHLAQKIASFCFWCCVVLGIGFSAVMFCNMDMVVKALGASGDTATMVGNYLKIVSVSGVCILLFAQVLISTSPIFGGLYVISNALQAAGASTPALVVNVSRQGLLFIPLLFILGSLIGINGLVFAQPVADIVTFVLAIILYRRATKTMFLYTA